MATAKRGKQPKSVPAPKRTKKRAVARILNCEPSRDTHNDWPIGSAEESGMLAAPAKLPPSVDLRQSWWKIGNQGDTGACVGWATADSVLRWHFVQAGRLAKTDLLSVRYVWMAAKETDVFTSRPTTFIEEDGTSAKAALDIARKFGVVLDSTLPFEPGMLYGGKVGTFYALAAQRRIAAYFNLGGGPAAWRKWLATGGPIVVRLDVDATWDDVDATGTLKTYKASTARGGHAVALVGYTPDHFIVRNSWGRSWGDKGFAYASNAYAQAAFTEAYGVAL
jgi:Papain family cysteine protease